jgi:quercetin dioxygenase-like cupin family protein
MEDWAPQGFKTQPHLHRSAGEAFYLLDGEITATIGREVFQATPGTFLYIPPQAPHSFLVTSKFARKLIIFSPPGTEEGFRQIFAPLPEGMTRAQWVAQVLQSVDQELVQLPET